MTTDTIGRPNPYRLEDKYPPTMTRAQVYDMTEYRLHRHPWEKVNLDRQTLTAVTIDRIYEGRIYWSRARGDMQYEIWRWYSDRPALLKWKGSRDALKALGKSSQDERLKALAAQFPMERMSELVHLADLTHSPFCDSPCPHAVPKTGDELIEEMLEREAAQNKAWSVR